ncbi:uncharacterized protein LOC144475532 isoform X2 [Augochlora pura]
MSGASRQVKNSLLSAAGGFSLENYAENALLVPVTPTTPAVLQDDAELENIVGKAPANSHGSVAPSTSADADSEFTPIPLHAEEPKPPENQPPPAKQSYFTSILSSLPNLSLSSITGDTPANQPTGQSSETNQQDRNPHLPPFDHRDPFTDTVPPPGPSFYEPRAANFARSGDLYAGSGSSLPPPPQPPSAPPTIPSSGDGPISYRLGNQRRLKYAPPPELTSTSKQYLAPSVQPVFTPQNVAPLSIFNPNEPAPPAQTYHQQPIEALAPTTSPSIERSTPEQLSQTNSLQESFRSSPVASAISYSSTGSPRSATPQSPNSGYENLPSRTAVPHSLSRPIPRPVPETATPQNTPVNFSFPAFETYPIQPDFLTSTEKDVTRSVQSQVDARVTKSNVSAPGAKPTVTFAPTSAIQISEKLEHLLQERKEESLIVDEAERTVAAEAVEGSSREVGEQSILPKVEPGLQRESFGDLEEKLVDLTPDPQSQDQNLGQSQVQNFGQSQAQDFIQSQAQGLIHSQAQNLGQSQVQNLGQSQAQDFVQSHAQNLAQSQAHNLGQSQSQDLVHSQAQNLGQIQVQNLHQSQAQNLGHSQVQNLGQSQAQDLVHSQAQNLGHSQAQDFVQSQAQNLAQSQASNLVQSQVQNLGQNQAQDLVHSQAPNLGQSQAPNLGQSQAHNLGQSQTPNLDQSQAQNFVPNQAEDLLQSQAQNLSQSRAAPPTVPSFHQFQQQTVPLTSSFLPEPVKSSVNYALETSNSSAFAEPQKSVQPPSSIAELQRSVQSASSFFESPHLEQFPPPPNKESNVDLLQAQSPRNEDQQQASSSTGLYSYFDSSPQVVPEAFWSTGYASSTDTVGATGSTQVAPPPQLYNPLQFPSELHKQSAPRFQPYVSRFVQSPQQRQQLVNQAQHYFPSPAFTYDAATGNDTVFPPMPPGITNVPEPSGTATLSPVQMSINPHGHRATPDSPDSQNLTVDPSEKRMQYRPVYHHWFYRKEVEHKVLWLPFSMQDSLRLEEVHNSSEITPEITIATDGGRYDVDILRRQRSPVYWTGASTEVRRCSWFFKGSNESVYTPYDESIAAKLEEEYKVACMTNRWNRKIELNNGEYIVFHGATVQFHHVTSSPEASGTWGNTTGAVSRPRTIKRGLDEFHIEDGEPEKVDHLLFLVHGIGSVCDLKFRSVEEVVDEFRLIALQLVQSHYRTASEQRVLNRIELLPVSWHTTLHSEDTGIDKKLQAITLPSIPKLRFFTNDTLLDILFYTSPVYCQTIMHTVGNEINRLYTLFKDRNPDFDGGVYLGGHSLGSLILFDLLCHQKPLSEEKSSDNETSEEKNEEDKDEGRTCSKRVIRRRRSKKISYVMGAAGTGQPYIHYPQLNFQPRAFFALGSPIGMFVTVRGIDMLGEDFVLPTCPAFFNIFHPFDPVAYRVEALINLEASKYRPMLIPHHKGRKRMHLEVREIMARVGADLKQKLLDSVWNTWNSVYSLAGFHRPDNSVLEKEIDKVVEEQLQDTPTVSDHQSTNDGGDDFKVGQLNGGRRIDYVLQEAPLESINEYIFAVRSHVCYWESEDTMLMILKEIYGSQGIQTDAQLPQHTIPMERSTPSPSLTPTSPSFSKNSVTASVPGIGIDPTAPASSKIVGPPPMCGFVKKL